MTENVNKVDVHDLIDLVNTTLDARDPYTFDHSIRVAELSVLIAKQMRLDTTEVDRIHLAAHLHDIGKIGVPDRVLNKTGKLAPSDWNYIQAHPRIGCNILGKIPFLQSITDIVLYHHERYDGKGYPEGISGEDIPLGSRIIAVADSFDAITTDRPYRYGIDYQFGMTEILGNAATQFCPSVVMAFDEIRHLIPDAMSVLEPSTGQHLAFAGHSDLSSTRRQV